MSSPLTISRDELAATLGLAALSDRRLRERLAGLYAQGLPRPLPGLNVWSRAAVASWIDGAAQGGAGDGAAARLRAAAQALEARGVMRRAS